MSNEIGNSRSQGYSDNTTSCASHSNVVTHEICLFAWVKYFGMELFNVLKNIAISLSHCFNGRALINKSGKIKQLCY